MQQQCRALPLAMPEKQCMYSKRLSHYYQCWVLHYVVSVWSILLVILGICIDLHGLHRSLRETSQVQSSADSVYITFGKPRACWI